MLQAVITRMGSNSFLLKGWSVVLVSAILALGSSESRPHLAYLAYFPAIVFWILDGYFLHQERLFSKTYDRVRSMREEDIDFSMNTSQAGNDVVSWPRVACSVTLLLFHGAILLTITAACLGPMLLRCLECGAGS